MSDFTKTILTAVVGAGKIAFDQHFPALSRNRRFELVALVDPRPTAVETPRFDTLDALFESRIAVDAIVIATPPLVRETVALEAFAAGCHVMLEKPPCATPAGARRLVAACPSGKTVFAAWHSREAPMVAQAKEWLSGRTIAKGRVTWREDARVWHPGQRWLWQAGGFGVFDPAINALSILTAISPARFVVRDALFKTPANLQAPIAVDMTMTCGEATIACDFDFREEAKPEWTIELETTDGGRLCLSDGGHTLAIDGGLPEQGANAEYDALYARFAALIDGGRSDVDTAPLDLVADAFLVARHIAGPEYEP